MADAAFVHPVRQRMIDDMRLRGFSADTQGRYRRGAPVRGACSQTARLAQRRGRPRVSAALAGAGRKRSQRQHSFRGAAYGAGLRASEVVSLRVSDIDSRQMTIRARESA